LDGLELVTANHATAHVKDHFAQGDAHGHFHEAGVFNVTGEGKDLGAFAGGGSHGSKPLGPLYKDGGDVGKSLHVVDHGGFAPQAADGWIGRFGCGVSTIAFDGVDESSLFTANEGTGTGANFGFKAEVGAKDVLAHQSNLTGLFDGLTDAFDGKRIFGADVEESLAGTDGIGGDHHPFQDAVRITFQEGTVHERARVSFVTVADDIFLVFFAVVHHLPLDVSGESTTAATSEPGSFDHVDGALRIHLGEGHAEGFITTGGNIFIQAFRIDVAAVCQGYLHLFLIEGHFFLGRDGLVLVL